MAAFRCLCAHLSPVQGIKRRLTTAPWTTPEDKARIHNERIASFVAMEFVAAAPLPAVGMQVLAGHTGAYFCRGREKGSCGGRY